MSIYLNNAATTWPKPEVVPKKMYEFMIGGGANLARGTTSGRDMETLDMVISCRENLARIFDGYMDHDPRYVTFTANITESLNVITKGYLNKPGMKVVTSSMEHNAVMRPLRSLEKTGYAEITVLECDGEGFLHNETIREAMEECEFDLMVLSHASNVCGTLQDLEGVSEICREFGVPLVVDNAQTGGIIPLSVSELDLAALVFTGHKGLMGPQGTGGIIFRPNFAEKVKPFIEGGTGSFSHLEFQPDNMPDKFEAGTPNLPGIAGLFAATEWLMSETCEKIHSREKELGVRLLAGLKDMRGVKLAGKSTMEGRLPVFPVNFVDRDHAEVAQLLTENYGIETRPGLHCSPGAHMTLGTWNDGGALRISPGYFNTEEEMDTCIEAISEILSS